MNALEALRAGTARVIAEDPAEIRIHRMTYHDDGAGGRVKAETDLSSFTGRLYTQGTGRGAQVLRAEAGELHVAPLALLAPWDADLRAGSDVEDTVDARGRRYRIRRVIPRAWQGEVHAVHALLEEVG